MLESIIPATIVIDKPEIGITSTKSSISCIEYDRNGPYKDSDCGGYPDNRGAADGLSTSYRVPEYDAEPHYLTIQDYVESKPGTRDYYLEHLLHRLYNPCYRVPHSGRLRGIRGNW